MDTLFYLFAGFLSITSLVGTFVVVTNKRTSRTLVGLADFLYIATGVILLGYMLWLVYITDTPVMEHLPPPGFFLTFCLFLLVWAFYLNRALMVQALAALLIGVLSTPLFILTKETDNVDSASDKIEAQHNVGHVRYWSA